MLVSRGDWMALGNADEQKPAIEGTVEAWGAPRRTLSAGGTASRRAYAGGSAATSPQCSKRSRRPTKSTTPETTGCGRSEVTTKRYSVSRSIHAPADVDGGS